MCYGFFSKSYFLKKERKDSKHPQNLIFHVRSQQKKLKKTPKSSFIKLIKVGQISNFSLNFKHIVIT